MSNTIRLTRQELYDQIWFEPVVVLAKRYGFSDVWLAKICRKHNIPRPPRGYWARKQSGQKVTQTPLPKKTDESVVEIYTKPVNNSEPSRREAFTKEASLSCCRKDKLVVPEILTKPHPLVKKSIEILISYETDDIGLIVPPEQDCLDIRVTKENLSRALIIMDTLIKALIDTGFEVLLSGKSTLAKALDVSLGITLGEELIRRRLKAKDHCLDGYYQFGYNFLEKAPTPSGILFLAIHDKDGSLHGGYHYKWRDTETSKLEHSLRRFISGLIRTAAQKKARSRKENGPQ